MEADRFWRENEVGRFEHKFFNENVCISKSTWVRIVPHVLYKSQIVIIGSGNAYIKEHTCAYTFVALVSSHIWLSQGGLDPRRQCVHWAWPSLITDGHINGWGKDVWGWPTEGGWSRGNSSYEFSGWLWPCMQLLVGGSWFRHMERSFTADRMWNIWLKTSMWGIVL